MSRNILSKPYVKTEEVHEDEEEKTDDGKTHNTMNYCPKCGQRYPAKNK